MQFDWKHCLAVDFKVVREDWQKFTLSDRAILKVKPVLTGIWRAKDQVNPITQEPLYSWNTFKHVRVVSYPQEYSGEQTTVPITPELLAQSIEETVDFESVGKDDEWSVYNLFDGTVLRLRLNITAISRTKFHGPTGEPLYSLATGQDNYRIKVAINLIQKPRALDSTPKAVRPVVYA